MTGSVWGGGHSQFSLGILEVLASGLLWYFLHDAGWVYVEHEYAWIGSALLISAVCFIDFRVSGDQDCEPDDGLDPIVHFLASICLCVIAFVCGACAQVVWWVVENTSAGFIWIVAAPPLTIALLSYLIAMLGAIGYGGGVIGAIRINSVVSILSGGCLYIILLGGLSAVAWVLF